MGASEVRLMMINYETFYDFYTEIRCDSIPIDGEVAKSEIYESSSTWKMAQSWPKIHQTPEIGHLQLNHFT